MNKKEALDFLELPDTATDNDIRTRMADKLVYFQRLSENAPNDFLRKLHFQNTEKVKSIQQLFAQSAAPNPQYAQPSYQQPVYNNIPNSYGGSNVATVKDVFGNNVSDPNNPAALLVRHTENKSAKTFSLFPGANMICRTQQTGQHTIVVDDDPYISRVHAVIYVEGKNEFFICDNAQSNGGKASKNGTYINGNDNRINQKIRLRENDTVQVGMTKFILRFINTNIHKIVHQVEEAEYMKTVVIDIF